jgi:hypothetical protein
MGDDHINNSLRQIDPNSWLVGNLVLRRLPYTSASATWNDQRDQSSYTLDEAPVPHPRTTPLVNNQYIEVVHEAGDASVVWAIGNSVFCKAKCITEGATPEPVTLQFVQGQQPSFSIQRYYSILFTKAYHSSSFRDYPDEPSTQPGQT